MSQLKNEDLTSSIVKFCKENCNNVICILLYGSYANGSADSDSDVDILVIDESCEDGHRIQIDVDGYLLQATIFSFRDALNLICQSRELSNPFYPTAFSSSRILYDTNEMGRYLQSLAEEALNYGALPIPKSKVESLRVSLINILNDGKRKKYTGETAAEIILWGAQVTVMSQDYYLIYCDEWVGTTQRFKDNCMQKINSELRQSLHCLLVKLSHDLNAVEYSVKVKALLRDFMSLHHETIVVCDL